MPNKSTQTDHYTVDNRHKRRVGQPEGKVWSVYNRGPAPIEIKWAPVSGEVMHQVLPPDCILSSWTQPVVKKVGEKPANFTVVTYFNG